MVLVRHSSANMFTLMITASRVAEHHGQAVTLNCLLYNFEMTLLCLGLKTKMTLLIVITQKVVVNLSFPGAKAYLRGGGGGGCVRGPA